MLFLRVDYREVRVYLRGIVATTNLTCLIRTTDLWFTLRITDD
jgi:hypothetical protein